MKRHAKGMLLEAKRAGEALLKAKAECKHGEFKAWVEANCEVGYPMAARYMQVARKSTTADFSLVADLSIRQFLDIKDKPKAEAKPAFTTEDAEYAKKLHALVERGEGGEAEVAAAKLK